VILVDTDVLIANLRCSEPGADGLL